ncbi:MAG: acetolactate synthase small subunit [Actinobacteria bacterium]|jgi:acetolactate synthase-1/3 small subunit|nr:acetolactate synthase small subunit [bacterium]MBS92290.1 acetolactate synthase small subunit [Actinomycetota bacterium]GIS45299.1 MAG: acetolactate synthase small subunit [Actinomycetota bacterium]|tara:strand:+ start:1398 stop:1871 length:474 start_codon:yes stop_codon:yes gene_type:complete
MSERILSVLVEDKPGVLARVASTISRRGFNINSLSVGPTHIEGRSKMTIVTELDAVEQVKKQLNKLVNVIKIVELDPDMTIETEVLLLKVSINKDSQTSVIEKASLSGANSVDVGQDYAVFELTGSSKELNKFEDLMKPFGIIEMVRGGRIAIQTNL